MIYTLHSRLFWLHNSNAFASMKSLKFVETETTKVYEFHSGDYRFDGCGIS